METHVAVSINDNWKVRRDLPGKLKSDDNFPYSQRCTERDNMRSNRACTRHTFKALGKNGAHSVHIEMGTPKLGFREGGWACYLSRCSVGCRENYRQTSTYQVSLV